LATGPSKRAVNFAAGSNPQSLAVGDFNGDGKADLAVANYNSGNVSVLLGDGKGNFQPAMTFAPARIPKPWRWPT